MQGQGGAKEEAITGVPAYGNMWGGAQQNAPLPQNQVPQNQISENYTKNPDILAEAVKAEQYKLANEQPAYDKMQMEEYLNNRSFGTGSQISGTMPYYADRLGRGIQSGNGSQIVGGVLGTLFQGVKSAMAGAGAQKTEDFMKAEGQRKMRDFMKSGKGMEYLSNSFAMGSSASLEDGGSIPINDDVATQQEQMPEEEQILSTYFEAKSFSEDDIKQFMEMLKELKPNEQQEVMKEIAESLSTNESAFKEERKPTILDGKTMAESTKVIEKNGKKFLQMIKETPISNKEAKDFKKFM